MMKITALLSSLAFVSFVLVGKCDAFSSSSNRHKNLRNIANGLKPSDETDDNAGGYHGDSITRKTISITAASLLLSASLVTASAPAMGAVGLSNVPVTETNSGGSSSMLLADSTSLDFSLPSYDTKMSGFGEGSEAFVKKGQITSGTADALMIDPGADEKEKQLASMRKAEEARKEALIKKKAEQKEREDEAKRRAKEKKARDAERLKNIWNS